MRVLLVGDSIMRGTAGGAAGGMRPALDDGVRADGIAVEWVGPYTTQNPPGYEACLHGAISGRTAAELAVLVVDGGGNPGLASMVASHRPTHVGVQVGINDKLGGATDAEILDSLDLAATRACNVDPSLVVLIGGPGDSSGANMTGVRSGLPARCKAHRDAGRSVFHWLGFGWMTAGLVAANCHDGLHPNATGDGLNRKEWQRVFRSLVGPPVRAAL